MTALNVSMSPSGLTFAKAKRMWDEGQQRSRTYENGHKAVRLKGRGVNHAKLYYNGRDVVLRLYNTDLAHWSPEGWITLTLQGWTSKTTTECIERMVGVYVVQTSIGVSEHTLRIRINTARDGVAPGWILRSVPFVEGMRIHEYTGLIHPDDLRKIPSDRRGTYDAPNKQARAEFKKLWALFKAQLAIDLGSGLLGAAMKEYLATSGSSGCFSEGCALAVLDKLEQGELPAPRDIVRSMFPKSGFSYTWSLRQVGAEGLTAILRDRVSGLRTALLQLYAERHGLVDQAGGHVLGKGYYVAPGDEVGK